MISIVICSVNPVRFNAVSEQYRNAFASGEQFELIGVHDAKSICEGYSRGLAASKGDIVIFSHDDIEIWTPEFSRRLTTHMQTYDVVGVAGTRKVVGPGWFNAGPVHSFGVVAHVLQNGEYVVAMYGQPRRVIRGMQALDGMFLAFRRSVIEKVGWDAQTFDGFHMYDVDCTFRAYRRGFNLAVAIDLPMFHNSHGKYDAAWEQYARAFMARHGPVIPSRPYFPCQYAGVQVKTRDEARRIMLELIDTLE
jgi:GT2 family glycosyltransferase